MSYYHILIEVNGKTSEAAAKQQIEKIAEYFAALPHDKPVAKKK